EKFFVGVGGGAALEQAGGLGGLCGGNDLGRGGPGVFIAAINGAAAHVPDVVEELLAVAGGVVADGLVGGGGVVDGLAEVPGLRGDGGEVVGLGELFLHLERDLHGGGVADGFGEEADHVVEVAGGAEAAVPPGGVERAGADGGAGLILDEEALHD